MALSNREKLITLISNGIAVYSLYQEQDRLAENTTMFDFILKVIPQDIRPELSPELIDEVFEFVSNAHSS